MESLYNDKMKDESFSLWNYWGVREMRVKNQNLYVIQYLPRIMSSITYKSTLPNLFLDKVIDLESYKSIKERETNQLRHLLYVGMTRARDYLTTLGRCSNAKNNKAIPTAFWIMNAGVSGGIMNQSMAELWGEENLEGNMEDITNTPQADQTQASVYKYYEYPELTLSDREPKYLSPSKLPEIEVSKKNVEILADLNCRIEPYNTKDENEAAAGTCIHNIFAVYDPALSHHENVDKATTIRNGNNMYDVIPDPEKVIFSIEQLYAWLEKTYGKPYIIKHEEPFIQPLPGQVVHGEIDLLWYTSEKECVLIDFKNFPGSKTTITTPGEKNEHYAGRYAALLKAYRDVLESSGLTVKDALIYYSVMGCIVRLNL
jgi:ATP-dependent exoDNAse (exonuclease V) beta subunit